MHEIFDVFNQRREHCGLRGQIRGRWHEGTLSHCGTALKNHLTQVCIGRTRMPSGVCKVAWSWIEPCRCRPITGPRCSVASRTAIPIDICGQIRRRSWGFSGRQPALRRLAIVARTDHERAKNHKRPKSKASAALIQTRVRSHDECVELRSHRTESQRRRAGKCCAPNHELAAIFSDKKRNRTFNQITICSRSYETHSCPLFGNHCARSMLRRANDGIQLHDQR